jgi:hypothetical protein
VKLWNFFPSTDGVSGHLHVSQSVVCKMATVQERAHCVGWLSETKSVTQTQRNYRIQFNKQPPSDRAIKNWQRHWIFSCGVMSRAMCPEHPLKDLMSWRPISGMRSRLFQRTWATEHGKSSNIVWEFSVLPREPRSRSAEVNKKKRPEFQYDCAPQFFKTPKGLCGHTV